MAAGWGITRKSENTEYTYKWTIEDFDFAMRVEGRVESASFAIPGASGLFNLVAENLGKRTFNANVVAEKLGNRTTNNGDPHVARVARPVPLIFSVSLKSTSNTTKAAGKLEVIKEGVKTQTGEFGDAARHNFVLCSDAPLQFKWGGLNEFYTTGSTSQLNLVANLTIPGKLVSLGGEEEMNQRRLDLKPLLLDPSYSDIVLKCGGESFPCHKAILAVR